MRRLTSPQRAQELFPLMSTTDVMAAAFLPTDGYIDPGTLVANALARLGMDRPRQLPMVRARA